MQRSAPFLHPITQSTHPTFFFDSNMSFYTDSQELQSTMLALFERLNATPHAVDEFTKNNMVVSITLTNPNLYLGLDGRGNPIHIHFTPDGIKPNLAIYMDADLLHNVWLGKVRLRDAFFDGRIKTKGSIFKAMKLAGLFRQAEALYPTILRERGLLS